MSTNAQGDGGSGSAGSGNPPETLSKVEAIKLASDGLRGTVAATLADRGVATFTEDDQIVLKFHGIYQQDNRDTRRSSEGGKQYSLMIRLRLPGGLLTPEQYLRLDELSDEYGNSTLRLTTRQSIQYHGVLKDNLKSTMRAINDALISTVAACGDVGRNVMAPSAPINDEPHAHAQRVADEISRMLIPATGAYHEIWLDGERVEIDDDAGSTEPLYGERYLPRKFKVGVALENDNSVDIYTYDCGLIGIIRDGRIQGFNLVAGGGLGMTHNKPDTIARMASVIGLVPPQHAVDAVRTVAGIYRDHGNRADRRHARLKYLLELWGVEKFAAEFRSRVSWTLGEPAPMTSPRELDYLGVNAQGDGKWFIGVFVENGRIANRSDGVHYRSAFRAIVNELRPGVRITPMQSVLFTDLSIENAERARAILREHNVKEVGALSHARRWSMACPALPTCGLALADSERSLPTLIDEIEKALEELGVGDMPLTIRMTGCPNGCARPYNADIGFVGRKPGVYHVFVGGGLGGDRLADLFAADVPVGEVMAMLMPLLSSYAAQRRSGESLSDYYQRQMGRESARPRQVLTGKESPTRTLVQLTVRS